MTRASDNLFPKVLLDMQTSAPAAPSDADWKLYAKADGVFARSSNAEVGPFGAGGGAVATDAIWDAAGDLAVGSGANTASKLSAGATSGHVLTSNGAGAAPSWQAAAGGGGLVLLEQQTASASATLDFTTFISATYDTYRVIGTDISPVTDATDLLVRIGTGGGPTYDTATNYEFGWNAADNASANAPVGGSGQTAGKLANSVSNDAAYGFVCFDFLIHNLQSTSHRKYAHGTCTWVTNAPALRFAAGGWHWVTSGTAATALRFLMSSGNIASGTIRIYGIVKS